MHGTRVKIMNLCCCRDL